MNPQPHSTTAGLANADLRTDRVLQPPPLSNRDNRRLNTPDWSGGDVICVLFSGQPQTDVTNPPDDELHGKGSTDDSVVDTARGKVDSGAAVRRLLGTA